MDPQTTSLHSTIASRPVRLAIVGYGSAGRVFHAPLVSGVPGLELHCIVSSKPDAVRADWPDVAVVAQAAQAFADPLVDVVVIATSNESHFSLARDALLAGKHVVVDKPCTVTLEQTTELLALAAAKGLVFSVFQNRRFDADFLSLQEVLASGVLGRIVHFESHFDRYRPVVPERWREQALPGSGLWFDLGAHLVDQALVLFGMPQSVSVDTACQRDGARVNDYFHAQLRYSQHPGLRVILHAGALVGALGPRFAVHGTWQAPHGHFGRLGCRPPHWHRHNLCKPAIAHCYGASGGRQLRRFLRGAAQPLAWRNAVRNRHSGASLERHGAAHGRSGQCRAGRSGRVTAPAGGLRRGLIHAEYPGKL